MLGITAVCVVSCTSSALQTRRVQARLPDEALYALALYFTPPKDKPALIEILPVSENNHSELKKTIVPR